MKQVCFVVSVICSVCCPKSCLQLQPALMPVPHQHYATGANEDSFDLLGLETALCSAAVGPHLHCSL